MGFALLGKVVAKDNKIDKYADVVVALPVEGFFTYEIPDHLMGEVSFGRRVLVPFGGRAVTGYVVALKDDAGSVKTKKIRDVLDDAPLFDRKRFKFLKWLSSYYFAPLGEVLSLTHPSQTKVESKRFIHITEDGKKVLTSLKGPGGKVAAAVAEKGSVGVSLSSLAKKMKGVSVHSAVEGLKRGGFVTEEVRLAGGMKHKTETWVEVVPGFDREAAFEKVRPYNLQAGVLKRVVDSSGDSSGGSDGEVDGKGGGVRLSELRRTLGPIDKAVKRLKEYGYLTTEERRVERDPVGEVRPRSSDFDPSDEQKAATGEIRGAIEKGGFHPFLLFGITGSGKTLVYIRAVEEALRGGRRALFLVPEIALTSRAVAYLEGAFPGRIAVVHSSLSDGERFDQWRRILSGAVDVVIGARSALFAPLAGVGVIIVDEEHETSYKQEEGVRYNARDSALVLGRELGAVVVLGSATPSMETFYNATVAGKLTPLYLKRRVHGAELPPIELLDMRKGGQRNNETKKGGGKRHISSRLAGMLEETLGEGGQSLLFINRRGFSSFLVCDDCGHVPECGSCSVSLTMHKAARVMKCHYCDATSPLPSRCPSCGGVNIKDPGVGTEKVEEEVHSLLPSARVGRMDSDTTRRKGSAERIVEAVEAGEIDVLVGTQMVSKGHHFPEVTLVGVVSGDTSLMVPDFRSSERTYHLVSQAAGRAGRESQAGRVLVQTHNPDHFCFLRAREHDFEGFFAEELEEREGAGYPPFTRLCCVRLDGVSESRVIKAAREVKRIGEGIIGGARTATVSPATVTDVGRTVITVLGPAPSPMARIKGRHRWQLLVKGADANKLQRFLDGLKRGFDPRSHPGVSITFDRDPASMA